jgi:hypothetical protein
MQNGLSLTLPNPLSSRGNEDPFTFTENDLSITSITPNANANNFTIALERLTNVGFVSLVATQPATNVHSSASISLQINFVFSDNPIIPF